MVRHAALKNLYETEKTIGTGGFAKVKLARHLLTGEKVAIKIMDKNCLGDDLPRVKMEVEALKNLSHHHICKLHEVIETDTHFFLVMEYCAGGELFDHIVQCNRLSEMESRSFFRQILSAVAYLHSKGYVHRDIKPENVLLDKDQCVKLIDFGLCAKPKPGIDSYLDTACGSPTYAAPELIKGDKYLGAAVDVWSMGVMLYALLCGCLPFESDKIDILYRQILSGNYTTPDFLSEGSRNILRAMLEINPSKRVTIDQLLCHPWVQLGYNEPVSFASIYKVTHTHIESKKQCNVSAGSNNFNGTYLVLPAKQSQIGQDEQENEEKQMQPPHDTPVRMIRKRPRSNNRESSSSPAPKKLAVQGRQTRSSARTTISSNGSVPSTPPNRVCSPSTRFLNSIERKFRHVRKVLTPKRRSSLKSDSPVLLTAKKMSNISTTSSSSPDYVREQLVKALNSRGIECQCKGYSVRGKLQSCGSKMSKLSFELEVCLIPTTANAEGSIIGIRRKRLKGDAWCYKRVCEEVLNMAGLK